MIDRLAALLAAQGVDNSQLTIEITETAALTQPSRTLDILTRNVMRLGADDFQIPAAEVTEAVLEELGRALLGERSTIGRYRTVLEREPSRPRPVLVAANG